MANSETARAFPPGSYVREELDARGWTQKDLAEILGRPVRMVNEIVAGKRAIMPDTAKGLSEAFGTSAELWMNLESAYRLALADAPNDAVKLRAACYSKAPVREMQRRGWIKETNDPLELETELKRFLAISSLSDEPRISVAARIGSAYEQPELSPIQNAWCMRAKQLASALSVSPFDPTRLDEAESKLRALAAYPAEARHLTKVLGEFGIRFVVVEPLQGAKIDGAAFWLTDGPVIAVSVRYDRVDYLWFTVMHEFAHIRNEDVSVDVELVETRDQKEEMERKANESAEAALVPQDELESFVRRVGPLYSKARINQFAHKIQIHPGIIVGQLHHRGLPFRFHREMLVKVREIVTSTALTDGWGRTVPSSLLEEGGV